MGLPSFTDEDDDRVLGYAIAMCIAVDDDGRAHGLILIRNVGERSSERIFRVLLGEKNQLGDLLLAVGRFGHEAG